MFTGIIQAVGQIAGIEQKGGDVRLHVDTDGLDLTTTQLGDSIAVSGVCLTAVGLDKRGFAADVSLETLGLTTLGTFKPGTAVNLELALTPTSRLGGHLVSGHVDGIGKLMERRPDGRSQRLTFELPAALTRYVAQKGSVCVDGVSLTVNSVVASRFDVNIVPHTLEKTTLGLLASGDSVNIEVDMLARYLERLLQGGSAEAPTQTLTREFLTRHGFIG